MFVVELILSLLLNKPACVDTLKTKSRSYVIELPCDALPLDAAVFILVPKTDKPTWLRLYRLKKDPIDVKIQRIIPRR